MITILFLKPDLGKFVSIDITIESGGKISVQLGSPLEDKSQWLQNLLNQSHHIPLSLNQLLKS